MVNCSFCGKSQTTALFMVQEEQLTLANGKKVVICEGCVTICVGQIAEAFVMGLAKLPSKKKGSFSKSFVEWKKGVRHALSGTT